MFWLVYAGVDHVRGLIVEGRHPVLTNRFNRLKVSFAGIELTGYGEL